MATEPKPCRARLKLVLCAAMWLWAGCQQPGPGGEVAGSGTELGNVMGVLKSPDRVAAAGVEVVLYPVDSAAGQPVLKTRTDTEGAFAFKDVDGVYRLLALDGAGNGVTVDSLLPSPSDTVDLASLDLAPLGSIRGFVKSHPTGSHLSLSGTPFDTSFAGDAGFLWEGIPAGTYWLQARQSAGMVAPASRRMVVTVVSGGVTELPDTLDLVTSNLEILSSQLPYRFFDMVRPSHGIPADSVFGVLNGERLANLGPNRLAVDFTLTESMLDSTRENLLEIHVHSGDSVFIARKWSIRWNRSVPVRWAHHAVRAVILALEPDDRPNARRPGPNGGNPQKGSFRVLERRRLDPGELDLFGWPSEAGGDSSLPDSIQATLRISLPQTGRGCMGLPPRPLPSLPGDTITFFLLPDSILGAVAFRPRTDERFEDLRHLGNYGRADWPLADSIPVIMRELEWHIAFRPEGLRIEWPRNFRSQETGCLATFRRFLLDSAGRVREIVATPAGMDPDRLLLHYRAKVGQAIDPDSLPGGGAYVSIDSMGRGVAGSPDSDRTIQLSEGDLLDLKSLLSDLPDPIPADWDREYERTVWLEGIAQQLRYLVGDGRGAMHVLDHAAAAPEKAGLFTRVETWLRERNLL